MFSMFANWLTSLAGLAAAIGVGMEAAGVGPGTEIAAAASAFGLAMAKDGDK